MFTICSILYSCGVFSSSNLCLSFLLATVGFLSGWSMAGLVFRWRKRCLQLAYSWALTPLCTKTSRLLFRPDRCLRCEMSSKWHKKVQGCVEVIWNVLAWPVCGQQMLRAVYCAHERAKLCEKASVLALGHCSVACSAVEWLSFSCQCWPAFRIDGIEVSSEALSLLF